MMTARGICRAIGLAAGLAMMATGSLAGSLTVQGEGVVTAVPDSAELRLSIVAAAPRAELAMADLSSRLGSVLETLKAAGLEDRALQTNELRLDPVFAPTHARLDEGAPRIDGYRARTGLTVRLDETAKVGTIVDLALRSGANGFDGVRFTLSDPRALREAARSLAVEDAMARARTFAEAAGVTLGAIETLREGGGGAPRPMMADMRMELADAAMPVAAGELSVQESVTIVFAID